MSKKSSNELDLTLRTPRVIGREKELNFLKSCLLARGERHFIYYWAQGGLGKTRLLEELQQMAQEAGPGFYTSGIIDLYHTDTHSTSDVERSIVEGLDPEHKYFARYRQERKQYELLRERGADPGVLERRRKELSELFVKDCREMAPDARKLVICFDTIELLQYESSAVEEMAGLSAVHTRLRSWLLDRLSQLANVLVVFAGRPKERTADERVDHQARLIADMAQAFGHDLSVIELQPFTLAEAGSFVKTLSSGEEVMPATSLPIMHRLTGGRPIFLHLIVDLLRVLSPEPRALLKMFDQYANLIEAAEDDKRLQEARRQMEIEILRGIFNETGDLGGYLTRLGLMPKGFDIEVFQQVLGLPLAEAIQLMETLKRLSFVKRFKDLPYTQEPAEQNSNADTGRLQLHRERIFFHDEMYQLLTLPGVVPNVRFNERTLAHTIIVAYYDPQIKQVEDEIRHSPLERRVRLRERLQKLQVERLYYLLARDPCRGYEEYKLLSEEANRRRWVGFSMRLLDEFLRFYNKTERRKQFQTACITHEQVVRESAQLWVERFYWWGQLERVVQFVGQILEQPDKFSIRPDEDLAILGNIRARWTNTQAILHGHNPEVVQIAQKLLERLSPLVNCAPEQALARARLCNAIGYQFRRGGLLAMAAKYYVEANAAFRKLDSYQDELAILLNNLSYAYARQGRMDLARPLAHEALQINETLGNDYSKGLTLSTLARIAGLRGNYYQAIEYGKEALELFRELEDAHGAVLAYHHTAYALRKMSKHNLEKNRGLAETRRKLEEARDFLDSALKIAQENELIGDLPELYAEQSNVYRELGRLVSQEEGLEKGMAYYNQSDEYFTQAMKMQQEKVMQANILQDLAEKLFLSYNETGARQRLREVEELVGENYLIIPGQPAPAQDLPPEYFWPLGKVERLRGDMAFTQHQPKEGLQYYVLAYAYFCRFSNEAGEMESMVESLYNHLRQLPLDRQVETVEAIRAWAKQYHHNIGGVNIESFLKTLQDLMGV